MDKDTLDLLKDAIKLVGGGLLGFGFGWWGHVLRERRDNSKLCDAIFQELANSYEVLVYHSEKSDFEFFKTKFKNEVLFVAYEAATKNPGAFYTIVHHGWLSGCFRQLKKLCELDRVEDKDIINLIQETMGWIENPPDGDTQKRLRNALQPKYQTKIL